MRYNDFAVSDIPLLNTFAMDKKIEYQKILYFLVHPPRVELGTEPSEGSVLSIRLWVYLVFE